MQHSIYACVRDPRPATLTFADRGVLTMTGGVRTSVTFLGCDMISLLVTVLWGRNASLFLLALLLNAWLSPAIFRLTQYSFDDIFFFSYFFLLVDLTRARFVRVLREFGWRRGEARPCPFFLLFQARRRRVMFDKMTMTLRCKALGHFKSPRNACTL